ncbi:Pimeloyl-ACP methyl ester carboxylesterase [Enhydrobacter aerosaccus]|uniref:Pimeloyl-ACP methyl ester carboxylesterase n=1 Tax=Enhydrobacter aerosaccus TaxID=225324 RepID=A0A1T4T3T6_9HYPH|nr:epoxide hydrolase family protein [Enhydrobacter aerosaccus]SKA35180.1 Pimeloyl-ACP methyl ester carboxylesterase [Enhydrobacter aerosaccus]
MRYDTPEPFKVEIPERALIDLDERLRRWRPPTAIADNGSWASGTAPEFLAELVDHWRHAYDWQRCQEAINRWPNYLVDIDGQRLHFIREPGTELDGAPRPFPLVITHGWPGSIVEFLHVIDVLAHPEAHGGDPLDAFDVIVPSLPGYGFSGPPVRPDGSLGPIGPRAIGSLWHRLVHDKLNYRRPYGVQGGDWGAVVSSWTAFDHPVTEEKEGWKSGVLGLHLNMMGLRPGIDLKTAALSAAEKDWLDVVLTGLDDRTAYQRIQATRPQTLGVALADSPVGLAAWIVEKFRDWSDCGGDPRSRFSLDLLLDNIMVYWLTGTAGTATWLYRGVTEQKPRALPAGARVETPTALAAFPADLAPAPPKEWIERAYNLRQHTVMPRGGHFAALEEPTLLVEDIRSFFRPLRFGAAND